jgi:hypothetical protein
MHEHISRLNEMLSQQKAIEAGEEERINELQEYFANQQRIKSRQQNNRFWLNFWLSVGSIIIAFLSLAISLKWL